MKRQLLLFLLIIGGIAYGSGELLTELSSKEHLSALIIKRRALLEKIRSDIESITTNYDLIETKIASLQQGLKPQEEKDLHAEIKEIFYRPVEDDFIIWYTHGKVVKLNPVMQCQLSVLFENIQACGFCCYQKDEQCFVVATEQALELRKGQTVVWSSGKDTRAQGIYALYPHPLDKDRVITLHTNGHVKLWDLKKRDFIMALMKQCNKINHMCITKNNHLVMAEETALKVRTLALTTKSYKIAVPEKITALCKDPSNNDQVVIAGKELQIWNVVSKNCVRKLECNEKVSALCALKKSSLSINNCIIAGTEQGNIMLWNDDSTKRVYFKAHGTPITHLVVDKHGRIISAAYDRTVSVWACVAKDTWEKIGTFKLDKTIENETL